MPATDLIFARYGDLPHMSRGYAERIEAFICEQRFANILELGFAHGKSSAVIAATLRDLNRGHLVTIDRVQAKDMRPNIDDVLAALDLTAWVTVHYASRSYTWRLMRMLEDRSYPVFDFCYIDGAHSWDADGFAFFLVDRLLMRNGWVLFDDLDWTYRSMEARYGDNVPTWLRQIPKEERNTRQVRKVWELLVKRHPEYGEFREEGQWGFARKVGAVRHYRYDASQAAPQVVAAGNSRAPSCGPISTAGDTICASKACAMRAERA
jgi:predicted O-methyltransferase YrrM